MAADITSLSISVKSEGIKEASSALGGLSTSSGNAEKRVTSLVAAMERLNTISKTSTVAADAFIIKMREQAALMQGLNTNSRGAAGSTQALAAAMALLSASLNTLNQNTQRADGAQRRHTQGMRDAHDVARGLSGSLGALWLTYGNVASMAVGVAIGASLKGVLTVGKDVEHTLESLRVKGGETVESANNMRDAIYSIGQGIYGPQEVAKALEVLVLAGLNATQAMAALRPALNLATAGGTDIKTAAEGLVTIGTAVGATADSYTMLADGITTAANISLASVESITNTVKRASVVNKLYGASFEDILIQASALANLGIKDTAAGTAITNFYSDMQGKSEKAKKALAELSMEFSDSSGRAKPLVSMIKELNTSLSNFTPEKQKTLIMDIFGERSKRDVVAITSMIRSASDEAGKYGSKLEEIAAKISEMAGASTLAAVQIALTTENQIKSMSNTLKVTLARTFTELEPQVNVFTAKMKEAFNSPQFAAALVTIASSVASVTVGLVNNIGPLSLFVAGIVALKLATSGMALTTMLTGPLMATATAFGSTTVAAGGATVATGLFGTAIRALPFIGLAAGIATVIGALIMYKFHMAGAKNTAIETAEAYRSNYLGALKDEADQIKRTTDNLAKGLPLAEAQTKSIKEQALAKAQLNNQNAIGAAQADLDSAKKGFNDSYGPEYLRMAEKNGKLPPVIIALTKELQNQKDASARFEAQALKSATAIVNGSGIIRQAYIKEQEAAKAAADAAAGTNAGAAPEDKHGDRVRLRTQLAAIDAEIEAGRRANDEDKKRFQSEYKQGLIGEISLIEKVRVAEADSQASIIDGEVKKMRILGAIPDQSAAYVESKAKVMAAMQATSDAAQVAANKIAEYYVKVDERTSKSVAEGFKTRGDFASAYIEEYKAKNTALMSRLESDIQSEVDADNRAKLIKLKNIEEISYASGLAAAQNKTSVATFNRLADDTMNKLKGIKTETERNGIGEMFNAAAAATDNYNSQLEQLKLDMAEITDPKSLIEAEAKMIALGEANRRMWVGVVDSINSTLRPFENMSHDLFIDLFNNGKNAFDRLRDTLKNGLLEMLYQMTIKKWIFNVVVSASGGTASSIATAAGSAGSGVASSVAGSALSNYASGAITLGGSTIAAIGSSVATGVSAGMAGTSIAGASAAYGAAGMTGVSTGLTAGSAIGSALAAIPVWGWAALAAVTVAKVFGGRGEKKITEQGVEGTFNGDNFQGVNFAKWEQKGGLFHSDRDGKKTSPLDEATMKQVTDGFVSVKSAATGFAKSMGLDADTISTYSKKISVTLTKDAAKNQEAFAAMYTSIGEDMAKSLLTGMSMGTDVVDSDFYLSQNPDVAKSKWKNDAQGHYDRYGKGEGRLASAQEMVGVDYSHVVRENETYSAALQRLSVSLVAVNGMFDTLNLKLYDTSIIGADMASKLVDLFGGLESMQKVSSDYFTNYYSEQERVDIATRQLSKSFSDLGYSMPSTKEALRGVIEGLDLTTEGGRKSYAELMSLSGAFSQLAQSAVTASEQIRQALYDAADTGLGVLESSIGREKDTAQAAYDAQIAIINAQRTSAEKVFNDTKTALTETLNAATASNTAFKSLASSLKSTLDGMYLVTQQAMRRQSAQEMIATALQVARNTGVLPTAESLSEALKTVSQPSENLFATFEDYATDFGVTAGEIADLNDITNKAVKKSDTAVDLAKMQISTLESNHQAAMLVLTEAEKSAKAYYDAEIARFDAILANAQEQLAVATGTQTAMLSLSAAISGLGSLLQAATSATAKAQSAGTIAAPAATSTSISSLYESLLGRGADAGGLAYWESRAAGGATTAQIADEIYRSPEYLSINGSHAGGLDEVPFDGYTAKLHRGEMVLPASSAKAVREDASNKEILDALNKLCEENSAENRSMASNLTTLRKLFERLSPDGQSIQTTPVAA